MAVVINQNNPIEPFPLYEGQRVSPAAWLIKDLQAKCEKKISDTSGVAETQWALLAVGISLFVLAGCFIGAAFAMSSLFLGKAGIILFTVSVLPLGTIPLIAPTDYQDAANKVNRELIAFAAKERVSLTPDNVLMYANVKNLIEKREAASDPEIMIKRQEQEEERREVEFAKQPVDPNVVELFPLRKNP